MPTANFSYTGAWQTWTVPAGVSSVTVSLDGAGSNARQSGHVSGTLAVSGGQVLYVFIGGSGGAPSGTGAGVGGAGDGAAGGAGYNQGGGWGGGGYSAIRLGSASGTLKCVAGGAGGDSHDSGAGGAGGASTGGSGGRGNNGPGATTAATGGTQSAGGNGGTSSSGAGFTGGSASNVITGTAGVGGDTGGFNGGGGGGGGGGYFCGGGGCGSSQGFAPGGGGGGGSSYTGGLTGAASTQGAGGTGHGQATITWVDPNVAPNNPTSVIPAAGANTRSTGSLAVSAIVSDPDGGTVRCLFRYSTSSAFSSYTDVYSSYVTSGNRASATLTGLIQNTHYYIRFYSQDPAGLGSGFVLSDFYTNRPPNAPTLGTLADGASFASSTTPTFSWTFSDPDSGDTQSYAYFQWKKTTDTVWTSELVPGATQTYTPPASKWTPGLQYNWRIQTRDAGSVWGSYSTTRTFTVTGPANPPTLTAPAVDAGVLVTATQAFTWVFSDPDVGDTQTKADVRYRIIGATTWTDVLNAATTAALWTAPANTFTAENQYEWQVRTYDNAANVGPYSTSRTFNAYAPPPAPISVSPSASSIMASSTPRLIATKDALVFWHTTRMEWQLATDSGFTANVKVVTAAVGTLSSTAGASSVFVPVANRMPQGTWYVRARQLDKYGVYGAYTAANQFSVSHPPTTGTQTPTASVYVLAGTANRFSWAFSDTSETDQQTAFQIVCERNDTGASVFDTGKTVSTNQYYDRNLTAVPKDVVLRWKIRVWDTDDVVGGYSVNQLFYVGDPPVVAITSPLDNTIVGTGAPTITWTVTLNPPRQQQTWLISITSQADGSEAFRVSGTGPTTRQYVPSQTIILNATDYIISLTITDTVGLKTTVLSHIHTQYTVPNVVPYTVDTSNVDDLGYVDINWRTAQPDQYFHSWKVYRRIIGDTTWALITEILDKNVVDYKDWLIKSGTSYQWSVTQTAYNSGVLLESPVGYYAQTIAPRTNFALSPSVEYSTQNWTAIPGTSGTSALTRVTGGAQVGVAYIRNTWSVAATAGGGFSTQTDVNSFLVGDRCTASLWIRSSKAQRVAVFVDFLNSGGGVISSTESIEDVLQPGIWTRKYVQDVAPASTASVAIRVAAVPGTGYVNWAVNDTLDGDGLLITKTSTLDDYFDGDSPGASWTGAPGNSTSYQDQVWYADSNIYPISIDHFWILDEDDDSNNILLRQVTGMPFTEEYEQETFTVIGRGRKKDYGTRLGYTGTISAQVRGSGSEPRLIRMSLEQLRAAQHTYWLRTPFGDLYMIAIGDLSFTPLAGVGLVEMFDVSIPFEEVS